MGHTPRSAFRPRRKQCLIPRRKAEHPSFAAETKAARWSRERRPLIVIVGANNWSETTDYIMPYGILRRAGVANLFALAIEPGPLILSPALKVQPDATVAEFDARYPQGADYVIVPAMRRDDDPAVLSWIRAQAHLGATIIGICAGAKVVANAGLLDGKRATTHWYSVKQLRKRHPAIRYVADRRYVVDGKVATTTGISASMPMALTLIEAIAGHEQAAKVASELGVSRWGASHDSRAFTFNRDFALTILANVLAVWKRKELGIELKDGFDEVTLALVADAWSRTYRSRVRTFTADGAMKSSVNGLKVIPDRPQPSWSPETMLAALDGPPAVALRKALSSIARVSERGRLMSLRCRWSSIREVSIAPRRYEGTVSRACRGQVAFPPAWASCVAKTEVFCPRPGSRDNKSEGI
jgi:putative intracellular protease/amidase